MEKPGLNYIEKYDISYNGSVAYVMLRIIMSLYDAVVCWP